MSSENTKDLHRLTALRFVGVVSTVVNAVTLPGLVHAFLVIARKLASNAAWVGWRDRVLPLEWVRKGWLEMGK